MFLVGVPWWLALFVFAVTLPFWVVYVIVIFIRDVIADMREERSQ